MSEQPLVSIALCVYNGGKYLQEQLDSIFNQDYKNIEVIAVDDGSTDDSMAILQNYAGKYPHLKIYTNETNLGYVKNFEKAIRLSTGKYISLADQDDIWHPEKISKQVAAIGDNIMVYHDSEFVDEQGKSLNQKVSDRLNLYEGDSPLPFVLMNSVSGHSLMFERSLIEHALPFDPNFFHDWRLAFVATHVGRIKAIPLALVKYRQHNHSTIDFLERKETDANKPIVKNELLLKKDWVNYCSQYDGPYSKYLVRLSSLIHPKLSFLGKIELFFMLAKYREQIYFINKTPAKKQLKMIRKLVFRINRQ